MAMNEWDSRKGNGDGDGKWRMETESCLAAFNTNASFHAISNPNSIWVNFAANPFDCGLCATAYSILRQADWRRDVEQRRGGGPEYCPSAAVASGYWSSDGLALLIWFTNRTRRPPHIVTHYYYYSQTLTYTPTLTHKHTHSLTCSAVLPQCFWQTHLVHLLHLLRRLPHFNCFCSHTNGSRTHAHIYIHTPAHRHL